MKSLFNYKKIFTFLICSDFYHLTVHADISYGSKFLLTTAGGCGVGGITGYTVAKSTGYDLQPTQTITWLGATTGCLTGALFSYFFYDDKSSRLNSRIAEQQKTIQDLSLQLAATQGQKQNGTFAMGNNEKFKNLQNPFDDVRVKEGVAKFKFDSQNLPSGLKLRSCDRLWQYTLTGDGNDVENTNSQNKKIVAVSKNFALIGFTFLYSPQDCFAPSGSEGLYAEDFFPGLTLFLEQRVQNWTAENFEKQDR